MSFCEHCAGQRFDRAQVLRALRAARKRLQADTVMCSGIEAIDLAIQEVHALEIPHLEPLEDMGDDTVVH